MELESLRFFIKVVEQNSFTKAAQLLNVPKSTISKAIVRLENQLNAKLLHRTTRNLTPTAAGRQLFDQCQTAIYQLESVGQTVQGSDKVIAGPIRLTASEDLGLFVLAPAISELVKIHPQITFDLNYTDQVVDLIKDGYDLAVRIGKLPQSRFKARKVGEIKLIMVASPSYVKKFPSIQHPMDLEHHECLSYRARELSQQWSLQSNHSKVKITVKSRIISNQMTSLLQLSQTGAGIALIPAYLCQLHLKEGSLIHILPQWSRSGLPVYIMSPSSTALTARLKVTSDYLAEKLKLALSYN